jgi:hypothetical protein
MKKIYLIALVALSILLSLQVSQAQQLPKFNIFGSSKYVISAKVSGFQYDITIEKISSTSAGEGNASGLAAGDERSANASTTFTLYDFTLENFKDNFRIAFPPMLDTTVDAGIKSKLDDSTTFDLEINKLFYGFRAATIVVGNIDSKPVAGRLFLQKNVPIYRVPFGREERALKNKMRMFHPYNGISEVSIESECYACEMSGTRMPKDYLWNDKGTMRILTKKTMTSKLDLLEGELYNSLEKEIGSSSEFGNGLLDESLSNLAKSIVNKPFGNIARIQVDTFSFFSEMETELNREIFNKTFNKGKADLMILLKQQRFNLRRERLKKTELVNRKKKEINELADYIKKYKQVLGNEISYQNILDDIERAREEIQNNLNGTLAGGIAIKAFDKSLDSLYSKIISKKLFNGNSLKDIAMSNSYFKDTISTNWISDSSKIDSSSLKKSTDVLEQLIETLKRYSPIVEDNYDYGFLLGVLPKATDEMNRVLAWLPYKNKTLDKLPNCNIYGTYEKRGFLHLKKEFIRPHWGTSTDKKTAERLLRKELRVENAEDVLQEINDYEQLLKVQEEVLENKRKEFLSNLEMGNTVLPKYIEDQKLSILKNRTERENKLKESFDYLTKNWDNLPDTVTKKCLAELDSFIINTNIKLIKRLLGKLSMNQIAYAKRVSIPAINAEIGLIDSMAIYNQRIDKSLAQRCSRTNGFFIPAISFGQLANQWIMQKGTLVEQANIYLADKERLEKIEFEKETAKDVRFLKIEQRIIDYEFKISQLYNQLTIHNFEIDSVAIEFKDGFIENIIIMGHVKEHDTFRKFINPKSTLLTMNRSIKFENLVPLGFSRKIDYENLKNVELYTRGGNMPEYSLRLEDVFMLAPYFQNLAVGRRDYSPENSVEKIVFGNEISKSVLLYKEPTKKFFEGKVFSDFVGLDGKSPNGIIQLNVSKRIPINTNRIRSRKYRPANSNFGSFAFVEPTITISKLEENNRYLELNRIDRFDANGQYQPEKFASTLDLKRYENFSAGFDLNLFILDKPSAKSSFFLNQGVRYGLVALRDSTRNFSNGAIVSNEPQDTTISTFQLSTQFKWEIQADERFRFSASYTHNFFWGRTKSLTQVGDTDDYFRRGERVSKFRDLQFGTVEMLATFRPNLDANGQLFFRYRYNWQQGFWFTGFHQAQVGYSFYILGRYKE